MEVNREEEKEWREGGFNIHIVTATWNCNLKHIHTTGGGEGRERLLNTLYVYVLFMMLMYQIYHLTFQIWKLTGSTTVGCMISLPGKTPQVTAMGWEGSQLVRFSVPCGRWGRRKYWYKNVKMLRYMHMWLNVHVQVNNIHCTCSSTTTNTSRVACRVPDDITEQWSSLKHAVKLTDEISSSGSSSGRGESLLELRTQNNTFISVETVSVAELTAWISQYL